MSISNSPGGYQSNSPLASTEEKSLHDNIDINKLSLEKGLKNRPNKYVLVDRGILLNPGKAHSDKMHLLDFAKKRDRLKKKIENRPEREELVRKLILQEGEEARRNERNKIKLQLDTCINARPGSLELVDKNILKVNQLFASKVHNGDISYPKVCLDELNFDPNSLTSLPSISEIDFKSSSSDLVDRVPPSPAKSSGNKGAQISCKKTCRVGRFSFHNFEFRPSAQKAREYQQKQLLENEKIEASLKMVHSELALKSQPISEIVAEKSRLSKYSLLNRLNVHELKSECKLRFISFSNVPKAQLVERLLPYEAEVLRSHTSIDQNRGISMMGSDRRSCCSNQSSLDVSPPQSNATPPSYQHQTVESFYNDQVVTKISHSQSEPIIQDYINHSESVSPHRFNLPNPLPINYCSQFPDFNPNNSYPLRNGNAIHQHLSCSSILSNEHPQPTIKSENIHFQSQPYVQFNGFNHKLEPSLLKQHSLSSHGYNVPSSNADQSLTFVGPVKRSTVNSCWANYVPVTIPAQVIIPVVPFHCVGKFHIISRYAGEFKNKVDEINHVTNQNPNCGIPMSLVDEYKTLRAQLSALCTEMSDFIHKEHKFKTIDDYTSSIQLAWLSNLQDLIDNNFNAYPVKYENYHNETNRVPPTNGLSFDNNGHCGAIQSQENGLDDLDMTEFLNNESNGTSDQFMHNNVFLEIDKMDSIWDNCNRFSSNNNDLKTPESTLSDLCNSPMIIDDLDHFMDSFLS